jgi:hypothetical protein
MMHRCLEPNCGKLFSDMQAHLRKHKMTVAEYNLKHNAFIRAGFPFARKILTSSELDNMQYMADSKERRRKRKSLQH